jgi:hypothetical protein
MRHTFFAQYVLSERRLDFAAMIPTTEEKIGHSQHAQAKSINVEIVQTIPTTLYYSAVAKTRRTQGFSITCAPFFETSLEELF